MKKLTRGQSCVLCQQRKIRCDKQKPCTNCVRAQRECTVVPLAPPKPRRSRQTLSRALVDRMLAENGVIIGSGEVAAPKTTSPSPRAARSTESISPDEASTPGVRWFAYNKEYEATDELLRNSGGDDNDSSDQPAIYDEFDAKFDDPDGFPFVVPGGGSLSSKHIFSLHPSAIDILQLWQIYIQRVDPLLKIGHVPTLQAQVIRAAGASSSGAAHAKDIPKPLEALMFAIYLVSIHAMADSEVQEMFREAKSRLLARYHHATQQALINAAFMRAPELAVLQAYILYLFSISRSVDPRSLFCLTGIAMRIATRLGLQRDCARFGMSPFETEMRRRLWWQTVILDKRLAEMTGSPVTALTLSASGDCCRQPLNINDLSLHPAAKEAPTPAMGHSEMLFSRTRIDLAVAMTEVSLGSRDSAGFQAGATATHTPRLPDGKGGEEMLTLSRPSPQDIDAYCAYFEAAYLQYCDSAIPVQKLTLLLSREALCNLRIFSFLRRRVPSATLPLQERDALALAAVQMVEYDTVVCTTESLRVFRWYADLYVPMLGSVFLANELRLRPNADLSGRAWKALSENRENRRGGGSDAGSGTPAGDKQEYRGSPIQAAFDRMLLKAWEACEETERQSGGSAPRRPLPSVIAQIKAERGESVLESAPPLSQDNRGDEFPQTEGSPAPGSDSTLAAPIPSTTSPDFDGADHSFGDVMPDDFGELDWMFLGQTNGWGGFSEGSGMTY